MANEVPSGSSPAAPRAAGAGDRAPLVGWAVPVTATLCALVVAVPVASFSGAAAPLALGDAGPLVRWGLPIVGTVHDLAASFTIGLLLVAAFLAREGTTTRRRETAAQMAFLSAVVWLVSATVVLYLTLGELAGISPSSSGYLSELIGNAWSLELLRLHLGVVLLVVPVVALTAYVRSRAALGWTFVLALLALVPLAFAGHSAGAIGHRTAVAALTLHLVGLTVWVGGLMAIAALLPVLGPALADTVRRFSTVATWCYVLIAVSGVLFATVTVGSLKNLATPYGVLLLVKVALLVVLGVAGYAQRSTVVARGVDSARRFGRVAAGEIVLMAAAVALGVVLGRTPTPVPEPVELTPVLDLTGWPLPEPFTWSRLVLTWRTDWLFALLAVTAIGLYVAGFVRLRRRGDRWPVHKLYLWVLGWVVFMWLTSGGPGVYGRVMFSMHAAAHMGLMTVVPVLLVPASAITLALRALPSRQDRTLGPRELLLALTQSRWAALFASPVVAALLLLGSLAIFYGTPLLAWALTTHVGRVLMVAQFSIVGYLFVWAFVGTDPGPRMWSAPVRSMVLGATLAGQAFLALAVMRTDSLLASEFYTTIEVPWVSDLQADQQFGGMVALGTGYLPVVALLLMVVLGVYTRAGRQAEPGRHG
ncbi:cytochrome c oxidase assembly protein [Serinicoccus sp. CUA-874]|uniref:cytochrome c oxidase assembly protein n=1 Tax=Serinicoccus sp. CUA-874 TaxID=1517939 RepID=UPI0009F958D8|nr:cytochrome c oxidase assembly protein [Serinicoccus sp. CUA-874]